jgi:hypothetical protein
MFVRTVRLLSALLILSIRRLKTMYAGSEPAASEAGNATFCHSLSIIGQDGSQCSHVLLRWALPRRFRLGHFGARASERNPLSRIQVLIPT